MNINWILDLITNIASKSGTLIKEDENTPETKEVKENSRNGIKVLIDPGHGESRNDTGVYGVCHGRIIHESDIDLRIASELAILLDINGFDVILTRIDTETEMPLSKRLEITRTEKPDIFISIHCNSNKVTIEQGIEVHYRGDKKESLELAKCINSAMIIYFPSHKDRGIAVGTMPILRKNFISASVLLESEFITNEDQAIFLCEKSSEIAKAVLQGIRCYCKLE